MQSFNTIWKELENKEISKRAFLLLSISPQYLTIKSFEILFQDILDTHPGL